MVFLDILTNESHIHLYCYHQLGDMHIICCHFLVASFGYICMLWQAKEAGSTRFCMGAAWRDTVGRKTNFNQILEYVKEIR